MGEEEEEEKAFVPFGFGEGGNREMDGGADFSSSRSCLPPHVLFELKIGWQLSGFVRCAIND